MTTVSKTKKVASKRPSKLSKLSSKKKALSPKPLAALEKKVLIFGRHERLWQKGDTLVLAVSGGADSMTLLSIFITLATKENLRLVVAHVNYRLRGEDSDEDARFVENFCSQFKIPFYLLTVAKKDLRKDEAALRTIRYNFFAKVRALEEATSVLLGHHKDDQAETFLLRLLRGSGSLGLQAMQVKRDFYIRPLLPFTRKDILAYLKKRGVSFRTDTSNADTHYLRNKIRHELLPLLAREYQPNITNILSDTALRLSSLSSEEIPTTPLAVIQTDAGFTFSQEEFLALSENSRLVFLRHLLQKLLSYPISHNLSRELVKLIQSTKNKTSQMSFHGLKITKKGATVSLHKITHD